MTADAAAHALGIVSLVAMGGLSGWSLAPDLRQWRRIVRIAAGRGRESIIDARVALGDSRRQGASA